MSYSLAAVFMELLPKDRANLLAFIQSAHREDAGQTAALDCLGVCLGQTAATFLGPGNWRPQGKAIKECWDQARAARKPASRRAFEGAASALLGGELG